MEEVPIFNSVLLRYVKGLCVLLLGLSPHTGEGQAGNQIASLHNDLPGRESGENMCLLDSPSAFAISRQ